MTTTQHGAPHDGTPTLTEPGETGNGSTTDPEPHTGTAPPAATSAPSGRTRHPEYYVLQKFDPGLPSEVPAGRVVGWFRLLAPKDATAGDGSELEGVIQASSRGEAIKAATEGFTLDDAQGDFYPVRAKELTLLPRKLDQRLYDSLDEPARRR